MSTLTVRLPNGTHERLKEIARHRGVSVEKLWEELSTIVERAGSKHCRNCLDRPAAAGREVQYRYSH